MQNAARILPLVKKKKLLNNGNFRSLGYGHRLVLWWCYLESLVLWWCYKIDRFSIIISRLNPVSDARQAPCLLGLFNKIKD